MNVNEHQEHLSHDRLTEMAEDVLIRQLDAGASPTSARARAIEELEKLTPGSNKGTNQSFAWIAMAIAIGILGLAIGAALFATAISGPSAAIVAGIIAAPFLLLSAWPAYAAMALRRKDSARIEHAVRAAEERITEARTAA